MARPKQNQQPQQSQQPQVAPKKKLSLNEFRAWLSGVEEMQPENWTPDSGQWRIIRSKIEEVIEPTVQPTRRYVDERDSYDEVPRTVRAAGPSAFQSPPSAVLAPPAPVPGADGKIKTPNIDTSNQPYVAAFE